jgi:DNA-binding protein HU-beta
MATVTPEKSATVVGKDELIHQVAAKAGLNLKETSKVIDAFTEVVREDVAQGHEVRLMGFGTWNLRDVAARKVKSIRGGKQITIPARKRVGFSVGAILSQAAVTGKTHSTNGTGTGTKFVKHPAMGTPTHQQAYATKAPNNGAKK